MGLGKGYDAHSFRHTFINELKQLQTPKEIIEALVGHEHKSQSLDLSIYMGRSIILTY